ncbi:MAG TPA: hypothetical protein VF818_12115 [Ktedonobacterales bacterium]
MLYSEVVPSAAWGDHHPDPAASARDVEEYGVTREQIIERLRAWTARAQSEAGQADNSVDMLNWTGQAQVLGGMADFLTSQGAQLDPAAVRLQVISGRQKSIAAWDLARKEERDLALHTGEVAGYDLVLALLKDIGEQWAA